MVYTKTIRLQCIFPFDISRIIRRSYNFLCVDDFSPFVDNLIFKVNIPADDRMAQNNAVLYNCALADLYIPADDGILNRTLDITAVGHHGTPDGRAGKVVRRAGIGCNRIERPFGNEQILHIIVIEQGEIRVHIALEVIDRRKIASVLYRTYIQIIDSVVDNIHESVDGRSFSRLLDQFYQKIPLHDTGSHGQVRTVGLAQICEEIRNTLLAVNAHQSHVPVLLLRVVYLVIKNGDVSAAVYMFVQQILKILAENHITWCDDDIFLRHTLNNAQVRGKCRDIGIVDVVQFAVLIEQKPQLAVLKVDIEVCAVAQMLGKRAGILSYINLNTVDFTVCEIGECEIDQPVSSKEGESAQRAVVLRPLT